jgi:hypothetical protein
MTAALMHVISVESAKAEAAAAGGGGGGGGGNAQHAAEDEVAMAMGVKEVIKNSVDLVEAAFDGELDLVKELLEKVCPFQNNFIYFIFSMVVVIIIYFTAAPAPAHLTGDSAFAQGYHVESEDPHKHTSVSEAACQGHADIVEFLVETLGADPNAQVPTNLLRIIFIIIVLWRSGRSERRRAVAAVSRGVQRARRHDRAAAAARCRPRAQDQGRRGPVRHRQDRGGARDDQPGALAGAIFAVAE